jgi:RNA polymerase sigma-B factor
VILLAASAAPIRQRELLRAYHEQGDDSARDRLVEELMPLVHSLARRYAKRHDQLEDLAQVGAIGLIKAIDRFDVERGVDLTAYAIPTIVGEIKRHFRDTGWAVAVPRRLKELNLRLARLLEELTAELGRSPAIAELAAAAEASEEEILEALEAGRAYSASSLSAPVDDEEGAGRDPVESLGVVEPAYEVMEDRAFLASGFGSLDERERRILALRFFDGLTQSQIAQEVGISQMHVSRLIRRSLERMHNELLEGEPPA